MCFDAHNKIRLKINHTLNPLVTVKKLLIWRKINMKLVNSFTKLLSSTSKLKTVHLQGFWSKTCISKKKTVHLQGFWPKTVYLKCFGNQLKTVYLQGPCSSRPCISRPCCIFFLSLYGYWLHIQQGLEIHGLEECGPWRYTVFNWFPKHLRYTVLG